MTNPRQSFLGTRFEEAINHVRVAIIGLGGGGSHASQQFAHIGLLNPVGFDFDRVDKEGTNLNRLVGATAKDAEDETLKTEVAERLYRGLLPKAQIRFFPERWQDRAEELRSCHVIIGCVDTFMARAELETFCRRFLIAYIDIGMDVHGASPPAISGQVILSLPGGPCMRCMGFITEDRLSQEGARYGQVGGRAQVVWPNAVLASTAVGLTVEILSGWTGNSKSFDYLVYDGNRMTVQRPAWFESLRQSECEHFPRTAVGKPKILLL